MFFKLFLVLLSINLIYCQIEEDSYSVELTPETFDNAIKQNNHFVKFYAPWCGFCKRLHPIWEDLAKSLVKNKNVVISKVDCSVHKEFCEKHSIIGYPTLKFFKLNVDKPIKYEGTRDFATMENFVKEQLGEKIMEEIDNKIDLSKGKLIELTQESFGKTIAKGKHFVKFYAPWCSHCQKLAPTWEELANSLENETVLISKIDCTQHKPICKDFEANSYPTLLWIEDGKKIEKYSGSRSIDNLKAYVNKQIHGVLNKSETQEKEEIEKSEDDFSNVIELSESNFESSIEKGITFVKFYAPWCGHCRKLSPIWNQLSVKMLKKDGIKIAKVDCTISDNKKLCTKELVEGYPTLFIYKNGEKIEEYNGSRQLNDLYSFVTRYTKHDEL